MKPSSTSSLQEISPELLQQIEFDISNLMTEHSPKWRHSHKKAIFERLRREGPTPEVTLRYTRWRMASLTGEMKVWSVMLDQLPGFFRYDSSGPDIWHLNFADSRLFAAYGSPLMAQDEWQVMEHPVLAAVREALLDGDLPALTRQDGVSTPTLLMNVLRQCELNLAGDGSRPLSSRERIARFFGFGHKMARSLYGNAFQQASLEEIAAVTSIIAKPSLTNVIAISALSGRGLYTRNQIRDTLETAWSGFKAATLESKLVGGESAGITVHTGWWGCGAFGGNRILMAMLQVIAARLAGVGKLVFHVGQDNDFHSLTEANKELDHLIHSEVVNIESMLDQLVDLRFSWGASDGN